MTITTPTKPQIETWPVAEPAPKREVTLDDFLQMLRDLTVERQTQWVVSGGMLRTEWYDHIGGDCPISFVWGGDTPMAIGTAKANGMFPQLACDIVVAADCDRQQSRWLRKLLFEATGVD